MTQLISHLPAKPERRALLVGAGSVMNLGGVGKIPSVMVFHARTPAQSVGSAWRIALGAASGKLETKR